MRCLSILATVAFIFSAIAVHAQDKNVKPVKEESSIQPYKLVNTNVTLGNPAYSQKMLWLWKYWQDNKMDKIAEMFDDNIIVSTPDGTVMKGKSNVIKAFKDLRDALASIDITVNACVALKSPDMPDREAVSIWATETDTAKDGTVVKFDSNEVWFFNKQGKVIEGHGMMAKRND